MKAIIYEEYGNPDQLVLKEIEKPIPGDNEVLVKVHAASINSWDWDLLRGKPYITRLIFEALKKPKYKTLGADIAGEVAAVGKSVTAFKIGEQVYGDLCASGWGAFAEYTCAKTSALSLKPESVTFEQAAAIPQAGVMALQGVRDYGKVKQGQRVLINGAGGGVGTFAIQLAKLYEAEVTAVDSAEKFDMMRSLGADDVIDYTQEDFTKNGQQYDLILDVIGFHSIYDFKRALKPTGIYRMIGGPSSLIMQAMFIAPFISLFSKKTMGILAHEPNKSLDHLSELFESDKIKPIIDRTFSLRETKAAFEYFREGKHKGKVIIKVL